MITARCPIHPHSLPLLLHIPFPQGIRTTPHGTYWYTCIYFGEVTWFMSSGQPAIYLSLPPPLPSPAHYTFLGNELCICIARTLYPNILIAPGLAQGEGVWGRGPLCGCTIKIWRICAMCLIHIHIRFAVRLVLAATQHIENRLSFISFASERIAKLFSA